MPKFGKSRNFVNKFVMMAVQQLGDDGRRAGAGRQPVWQTNGDVAEIIDTHDDNSGFAGKGLGEQTDWLDDEWHSQGDLDVEAAVPVNRVKPMSLPYFDKSLVAGFPIPLTNDELAQDIELLRMLCPNPEASYLIRVQGDSMIEAGIHDGDILIVDKSNRRPSPRQAAVCELNGEYTVKRVVEDDKGLWLVPANPNFPKIHVKEGDSFTVWGVVTYVIHKPIY